MTGDLLAMTGDSLAMTGDSLAMTGDWLAMTGDSRNDIDLWELHTLQWLYNKEY